MPNITRYFCLSLFSLLLCIGYSSLAYADAVIKSKLKQHPAVLKWHKQAVFGHAEAQFQIAELYNSIGHSAAYLEQAKEWYELAAMSDYGPALLSLGLYYEQGRFGQKDTLKANSYYARALGVDLGFDFSLLAIDVDEQHSVIDQQQHALEISQAKLNHLIESKKTLAKEFREVRKGRAPGGVLRSEFAAAEQELKALLERQKVEVAQAKKIQADIKKLMSELGDISSNRKFSKSAIRTISNEVLNGQELLAQEVKVIEHDTLTYQRILARAELPEGDHRDSNILAMKASNGKSEALKGYLDDLENSLQHRKASTDKRKKKLDFLQKRIAKLKKTTARTISNDEKVVLRRALTEIDHRYQGKVNYLADNLNNEMARVDSLGSELAIMEKASANKDRYIQTIKTQLNRASKLVDRQSDLVKQQSNDLQEAITQMNAAHLLTAQVPATQTLVNAAPADLNQLYVPPKIQVKWPQVTSSNSGNVAQVAAGQIAKIIGSAYSPSEIVSFTVNGRAEVLDENGLFMVAIEMGADEQKMTLSIRDKAGTVTNHTVTLQPVISSAITSNIPQRNVLIDDADNIKDISFGNYHALVIGNNQYDGNGLYNLDTAVNDAESLAVLLEDKYGFDVTLILNATRDKILLAMESLRSKLTENDNLLIYYAGHGIVDPENDQGYWIPVDGSSDSTSRWLSNATITDQIRAMNARNVMVIADSCYSGSLMRSGIMSLRSGLTPEKKVKRLKQDISAATRVALSSGGLQPVVDSIDNSPNSVFTGAMLKTLSSNDQLLDADSLATTVGHMVAVATKDNVKQVPRYAPLLRAGHEGGEFYFVPTSWREGNAI